MTDLVNEKCISFEERFKDELHNLKFMKNSKKNIYLRKYEVTRFLF